MEFGRPTGADARKMAKLLRQDSVRVASSVRFQFCCQVGRSSTVLHSVYSAACIATGHPSLQLQLNFLTRI